MEERLRNFAYLVDGGSFTKAAQDLHVSQPALSAAISKLERELKNELVVRGSVPMQLTPAGKAAYASAQALRIQTSQLTSKLAELAGEKPSVALGMIDSLAAELLAKPAPLDELEAQAKISIVVNNSPYLLQAVEQQRLDIAFVVHQPVSRTHQVAAKRLGVEPLVAVCHPTQLKTVRQAVRSGGLLQFISYEARSTTYGVVREGLHRLDIEPSATFYATSPEVMLQLVLLKKGVAVLPLQLVRESVAKGTLALVGKRRPIVIERPIDVVYRPDRRPIDPMSDIIRQIRGYLSQLMSEAGQLQ